MQIIIDVLPEPAGNINSGLIIEMCTSWLPALSLPELAALADTYRRAGINTLDIGNEPELFEFFQSREITGLLNIGHPQKVIAVAPKYQAKDSEGNNVSRWACQEYILHQGKQYMQQQIVANLHATKAQGLFYLNEITPTGFCFCARCRRAFA